MNFRRYAIYHLPGGDLGAFGAAWLGWDVRAGTTPSRPDVPGLPGDAAAMTAPPMRYGFHATIKAPFRLAEGHEAADVIRRAEMICDHLAPFALPLELRCDHGFVALRPVVQPPELMALEQALVTRLDDLRAPLTPAEYERRKPDALPGKARAHLDHWGYPWVLDLFNYHLTLSSNMPADRAQDLRLALTPALAALIAQPMPVTDIALVGEDEEGRFHHIADVPLRG
ncbi:DUF1045 domain-containing protein [Paracoccus laeviglucosivorans]|uniref:Phosphonate metabolism protein n=1 Tax=Paracoccus laeviglucosivorans TaxID=1197861 RepID=A0A521ACN6_9RHOB|nr:DUF1045 domain-containing protein [Paracoccus laeviglucosivorans]SMO32546.1 Protein of unknown function [Paracoccus laeviglucosivorans]